MNFIISFSIFFILLHPSKSQDAIVNGTWAPWGDWGGCDKPCGTGFRYRWRKCTNPAPQNGGLDCAGDNREHKTCNTNLCERELGGTWRTTKLCKREQGYCLGPNGRKPSRRGVRELSSEMRGWKIWERKNCMQKCLQTRGITACEMPFGSYRTHDYSRYWTNKGCYGHTAPVTRGNGYEKTYCWVLSKCKTDGVWSQWSSWTGCPVCGPSGQRNRTRTCTDPEPLYGGSDCPKTDKHTEIENCEKKPPCPIHGKWSKWGFWGKCSRSCGTGRKTRTRTCTNPAPQHGGLDCTDSDTAVQNCNTKPCSVHGNWADWSSWGKCSASCGTSQQTRTRTCTNPAPQHGGLDCTGSGTAIRNCNTKPCPDLTTDKNEIAEKVCKMKCIDMKRNCGQMLGCGDRRFDVSKHCPETCASTTHRTTDENEVAEKFCKMKCIDMKRNCGQMLGCGDQRFDVSKHCPETCASTTHRTTDENEVAEKFCKMKCIDMKRNCGQMLGCGDQRFDVSKHCPETCASTTHLTTDENEIAEKVCKMKCIDMKRNCGQVLGCGDRRFDVSKHCPKTCASTTRFIVVCEPKKEVMVMCYGRSYTLHGKAKNGASAKQYEWYKKSKKDSLVQLDSDSQYSITYSDRDPTKSSLTIRSFSMVKHEGFYAFRKANLNYIDCYDYKVTAFLQLEYNDGKDKFDVLAGEDLTLAVKAKDPASKTSWTVNGQSLIEPLIKASPHYNLPSTDDFGPTAQILEILNPQRRHGGIYKLKWSTRFHQCPIANIYFNVTVRERDTTSTTTSPTTITTTSVITTTPPSLPSTDKPVLKVGQKYVSQDENDDSIGFVMLIVGTFLIGLAIESVLWYFYKRELARKIRRSLSISLLHKDKNYKSESINQDELATDEENSDSQPLLHNGNVTPNSLQPIPSYRYGEGTLQ
ncbi:uncharacterized protein [Clytia hemisphaerica]|uniref:uncharacterized protein isoform X3 n=1 Tax=Clytia hemisphaerica TaxID=252671 RepID=UPI0034D5F56C